MNTVPATVLVIEAHPMMREALRTAIETEPDLTVAEQAVNNDGAVQMMITIQPDVIFLTFKPDMILFSLGNPGLGELEALKALRNFLTDTPILALTSNEVDGQEQAALDAGAQIALTKVSPRAELISKLRELRTKAFINHSEMYLEQEANGKISE